MSLTCLQYKSFENTVGKEAIARNKQFLLLPQCFLPVWRTFRHFRQIQNCRLQSLSVWNSLKFVVWEMVNHFPNKPWFLRVCNTSLVKTLRQKEKFYEHSLFLFFTCLKSFLPFSSNSKLSSAKSFNLEESKICRFGNG